MHCSKMHCSKMLFTADLILQQCFVIFSFAKRTSTPDFPLKLSECEDMMKDLQDKYPVEYKIFGLSSVAVAIVFPLIRKYLDVRGCVVEEEN